MNTTKFTPEEISELEMMEVRGGATNAIHPQPKCSNYVDGCGKGVPQEECSNYADGCGGTVDLQICIGGKPIN